MVGQQGGRVWDGKCPALLGAHGSPTIYAVFPEIDWGFVSVDDFAWLLWGPLAELRPTALLAALLSL